MKDPDKNARFQAACALLLVSVVAVAQPAQSSPTTPPLGSISGAITDAATGAPAANALVTALPSSGRPSVRTDVEGHYILRGLAPGQYRLVVAAVPGFFANTRGVSVNPGQALTSIDFRLKALGQISGKVLNENGEPVAGVDVLGLGSRYQQGTLSYLLSAMPGRSDDRGEYVMPDVFPDVPHVLMAAPAGTGPARPRTVEAVSVAPDDPKQRRQATVLSYYPDATSPENAQAVTIRPGEKREHVDIRLLRAPSYCVESTLERPASQTELRFLVARQGTSVTVFNIGDSAGRITGPDGKLRVCDLAAGDYRLTVTAISAGVPASFGFTPFSVSDHDVRNIRVALQPAATAAGEVVLDGPQPAAPLNGKLSISLIWRARGLDIVEAPIPGQFSFRLFPMGDYFVSVQGVPDGWYLKDLTYGGVSVLHRLFRPGSFVGNVGFRVVLARDGGSVATTVTDADGKLLPTANSPT
jgi:hypothetical protein